MGTQHGLRREYGGMPIWGFIACAVFFLGCGVYLVTNMPAPASAGAPVTPYPSFTAPLPTQDASRSISVVGDSNTEVNSDDFSAGRIGDASWVSQLVGDGYTFRGGWADGGTTSGTQADNLTQLERADITIIMTSTNDLGQSVSFDVTAGNIDRIVAKAPADRVVLLAIPPRDDETDPTSEEQNVYLQQLAQDRGWEFFDGLTFLRSPDGGFVDGTTEDGVHLTREAQARYGQIIREHLIAS